MNKVQTPLCLVPPLILPPASSIRTLPAAPWAAAQLPWDFDLQCHLRLCFHCVLDTMPVFFSPVKSFRTFSPCRMKFNSFV